MATILILIIYIAFISLGLPDALLGSAWPVMQTDLGVPYSFAGIAQILISSGTICSSIVSGLLIRKFGTGLLTAFSVFLTCVALFGFSYSSSFVWILFASIPLGLGAGAVDAALNAYVANHYESRHMSWLHSFWGVGAFGGPLLLSVFLHNDFSWRTGYLTIANFQAVLVVILITSIPLWGKIKRGKSVRAEEDHQEHLSLKNAFRIEGVPAAVMIFLFYCGTEYSVGLWGGSYLVKSKGFDPATAAMWISLFYVSITIGRFAAGFLTLTASNRRMITSGVSLICAGSILMILSVHPYVAITGLLLIGLGCAPIFPCMIHETPKHFGIKNSDTIIGLQMAFANIGATCLPPFIGFIGGTATIVKLPYFLFLCAIAMMFLLKNLKRRTSKIQETSA